MLQTLSNQFYTAVPHDFGMRLPPIIDSAELLKAKVQLVEALGEVEIASGWLRRARSRGLRKHPLDLGYSLLACDIKPLPLSDPAALCIERMMQTTHAPTHNQYSLEIQDVFTVSRREEKHAFLPFKMLDRQLLWHGSPLTNMVGILSQGLRIAPLG